MKNHIYPNLNMKMDIIQFAVICRKVSLKNLYQQ